MKVEVQRSNLLKSLGHVQGVVEKRGTIPVLSNVLMEARCDEGGEGTLVLRTTDLDIEIVEIVKAKVEEEGKITVPAHLFYEIVRKLPEEKTVQIAFDASKESLQLQGGGAHFTLRTLPAGDFPSFAFGEASHNFSLPGSLLKNLLHKTRFAMSSEGSRYYLNGIYLHRIETETGSKIRAVATDGHRLAQIGIEAVEGSEGMPGVIIPRKTVHELTRIFDGREEDVQIALCDSHISFTLPDVQVTSKLVDGQFPDYDRVVPKGNTLHFSVSRDLFSEVVDRISTVSSTRTRAVKMKLEEKMLNLSVNDPDLGNASETLEVSEANQNIEIGFNARYLLDVTAQIETEELTFSLSDPGAPALMREAEETDSFYVIMPMRI